MTSTPPVYWLQFAAAIVVPVIGVAFAIGALFNRVKNVEDKFDDFNADFKDFKKDVHDDIQSIAKNVDNLRGYVERIAMNGRVTVAKAGATLEQPESNVG